jgi:OmpA-OmpF porin, OOP family
MKKLTMLLCILCTLYIDAEAQLIKKLGSKIKDKVNQRVDEKTDKAIDKGLDKVEGAGTTGEKKEDTKSNNTKVPEKKDTVKQAAVADETFTVYNNYDFVPGDKILFEDNFIGDRDGEFPAHWELQAGQAVLNNFKGEPAMFLTEGNYVRVAPRMKVPKYLKDPFTIEFDYYDYKKPDFAGSYGTVLLFGFYDKKEGFDRESPLSLNSTEAGFSGTSSGVLLNKVHTAALTETFENKWHHVAIAVKNHQLKVYVDQYRVLVVPDTKEDYDKVTFAGIGDENAPIIFKNVRIASGGDMNMIGKKFTDAKIVTHGINFDVNKATIKPESMGTLNMIVQLMKENPEIKFEVGGHTDSDGSDDANLKLSEARSKAVREQLIKMGIDPSRLTAKGYGESKPLSDNNTPEGKANNRRVEFVKL